MLRPLRLTSSRDFDRVFRSGVRGSTSLVTCVALAGDQDRPPRVGFTVGSAIGGAVKRNRAKRLLREAVRASCIKPGADVVLVAKRDLPQSTFEDARAAVDAALEKAGVAC